MHERQHFHIPSTLEPLSNGHTDHCRIIVFIVIVVVNVVIVSSPSSSIIVHPHPGHHCRHNHHQQQQHQVTNLCHCMPPGPSARSQAQPQPPSVSPPSDIPVDETLFPIQTEQLSVLSIERSAIEGSTIQEPASRVILEPALHCSRCQTSVRKRKSLYTRYYSHVRVNHLVQTTLIWRPHVL